MTTEIRPEMPGDSQSVRAVVEAAFPTSLEADLVEALRADPAFRPDLSLVAEEEGQVVGFVMLTEMVVGGARRGDVLALAPIAVAPEHQRRGVGTRLMREVIDRARDAGTVVIVLVGEPGYYRRFGFVRASEAGVTAPPYPVEYLLALPLTDEGRGVGEVAYAAPFAEAEE